MEVINRYITIKGYVEGEPKESDFEIKSEALALRPEPASNDVILKNLYASIDPYQINRLKTYSSSQTCYSNLIIPGKSITAYGVARVVVSENPEFEKGDLVVGFITWAAYSLAKQGKRIRKFNPMGFPLSYHVGVLGCNGLAAYVGLFEICKPKKGEKIFVSAAAGAVGHLVGQFAKVLFGCYVVGSAGSKEKVALLKEKLGFDDAFNYKEETDLNATLKRYFPDGIDIYFDNVGGEMQDAAVANLKNFGKVALCGVISEYVNGSKQAAPNMQDIIYKSIKMQGFMVFDYFNLYKDLVETTCEHLRNGKIQPLEDVSNGVESIPSGFVGLYRGDNIGKKVVRIAEE